MGDKYEWSTISNIDDETNEKYDKCDTPGTLWIFTKLIK